VARLILVHPAERGHAAVLGGDCPWGGGGGLLSAMRAHTNAPYKTDLLWETLRALNCLGGPGQ
jgi:hypothetical protein